jgi:multiple sugar transport system permease protein
MLRLKHTHEEAVWAYLFILPAIIGFVVFAAFPIGFGFWLSLTKWDAFTPPAYVAMANYRRLFALREPLWYWRAVSNTLFFVLMMPVGVAIQLLLALMVNMELRLAKLFRSVFFLPTVTSVAVVAMVWFWMYDTNFGLINWMLSFLKIRPVPWLES